MITIEYDNDDTGQQATIEITEKVIGSGDVSVHMEFTPEISDDKTSKIDATIISRIINMFGSDSQ